MILHLFPISIKTDGLFHPIVLQGLRNAILPLLAFYKIYSEKRSVLAAFYIDLNALERDTESQIPQFRGTP